MPNVKSGEKRDDFLKRCIPMVMNEGADQDAAVGKCEGIYNEAKKSEVRHAVLKSLTGLVSMFIRKVK
jgi:hypothetical protein